MQAVSAQLISAARASATEAHTRVRLFKSRNLTANPIASDAVGTAIRADLAVENVTRARQPLAGTAYGVMGTGVTGEPVAITDRSMRTAPDSGNEGYLYYLVSEPTGGINATTGSVAEVTVDYQTAQTVNMLRVVLENTIDRDTWDGVNVTVQTGDGTTYTNAYVGTVNNADGLLELYWNGAWSTTESYAGSTTIQQVRVIIHDTVVHPWHPAVLSVDALHAIDLSDVIEDVNVDMSTGTQSLYLPFEAPSLNTANFTVSDHDQTLLILPTGQTADVLRHCEVTIDFGINTAFPAGSTIEYVRAFTGYVIDTPYSSDNMSINFDCEDKGRFMQEDFCDDAYWADQTAGYIIRDILARSGYNFRDTIFTGGMFDRKLEYMWTSSEDSVWDALTEAMLGAGGTMFINEYGRLKFVDYTYLDTTAVTGPVVTYDATNDLELVSQRFDVTANKAKVLFERFGDNVDPFGLPTLDVALSDGELDYNLQFSGPQEITSVLWEPSETIALGSASLIEFDAVGGVIAIDATQAATFPEQGEVFLNNEYITYDSKTSVPADGTYTNLKGNVAAVELGIKERGVRGSTQQTHLTATEKLQQYATNKEYFWLGADKPLVNTTVDNGALSIESTVRKQPRNAFVMYYTSKDTTRYKAYGATFTFREMTRSESNDGVAGLYMQVPAATYDSGNRFKLEGVFIEIGSIVGLAGSDFVEASVRAYKMTSDQNIDTKAPMPPTEQGYVGFQNIRFALDRPIRMDVLYDSTQDTYIVNINGLNVFSFKTTYSTTAAELTGLGAVYSKALTDGYSGYYVRGNTHVDVDYYYRGNEFYQTGETVGIIDPSTNQIKSYTTYFSDGQGEFEEFGSIAHEVRDFETVHQIFPNKTARIFNSNVGETRILEQSHNAFRSNFTLQNTSRSAAILNGIDKSSLLGFDISHSLFVYGNSIVSLSEGESDVADKASIRKYGKEEVEVDSFWVQSQDQADILSNAIVNRWAEPNAFMDIEYFPVPGVEVGDEITLDYNELGFGGAGDRYFIKSISLSFDGGLSANSTVQRYTPL